MESRSQYQTAPAPKPSIPTVDLQPIMRLLDPQAAEAVADLIERGKKVQIVLHFANGRFDFADAHLMTLRPERTA